VSNNNDGSAFRDRAAFFIGNAKRGCNTTLHRASVSKPVSRSSGTLAAHEHTVFAIRASRPYLGGGRRG
jgi:hypothetical protein